MNRACALLSVSLLSVFGLGAQAFGQNVVHNHIPSWGSGNSLALGYLNIRDDNGSDDARTISGFVGDGNRLHSYEGYYLGFDETMPNWSLCDFSISFWNNENAMMTDPRMSNPTPLDRLVVVTEPSNPNWETPVFQIGPWSVYHFVFNLDALNVETSLGATHFISVSPMVQDIGGTGRLQMLGALGGPNDVGTLGAWNWFLDGPQLPVPTTFYPPNYPYIADRITTIPGPGAGISLLALLTVVGRRRRTV